MLTIVLVSPAFTRTLTTVYTLVLLTLHTRIQLNILGRYSYIRSVRLLESTFAQQPPPSTSSWWSTLFGSPSVEPAQSESRDVEIDQETEMVYLTFSWWLMNVGWREVKERVQLAVEEVFGPYVPLSRPLPPHILLALYQN